MTLDVVLLDVDGTLLDTTEFILQAFEHVGGRYGLDLPGREAITGHVGRALDEIYAEHAPGQPTDDLVEAHRSFQHANLHLSRPYDGAVEALAELRASGYRLAAITNRSRRTSVVTLERAGMAEFFEVILSAEDSPALKPDPAPLRLALERMSAAKERAVMVGDTPADILAGQALGIPTIAALYGFHGEDVRKHAPAAVIGSISELPAALLALGARARR